MAQQLIPNPAALNFAQYGVPFNGIEQLDYFPHPNEVDETTQLPFQTSFYYGLLRIILPEVSDINIINNKLVDIFKGIEGLKYEWNPIRGLWSMEYGTTPKVHTFHDYVTRLWCQRYYNCAHQCALTALNKYPYLQYDDDDDDEDFTNLLPPSDRDYWGTYELFLTISKKTRQIHLAFNRVSNGTGYHTYYRIYGQLVHLFGLEGNWDARKNYLFLDEGTYMPTLPNTHIETYLFNDGIMKEVSAFMSGNMELLPVF